MAVQSLGARSAIESSRALDTFPVSIGAPWTPSKGPYEDGVLTLSKEAESIVCSVAVPKDAPLSMSRLVTGESGISVVIRLSSRDNVVQIQRPSLAWIDLGVFGQSSGVWMKADDEQFMLKFDPDADFGASKNGLSVVRADTDGFVNIDGTNIFASLYVHQRVDDGSTPPPGKSIKKSLFKRRCIKAQKKELASAREAQMELFKLREPVVTPNKQKAKARTDATSSTPTKRSRDTGPLSLSALYGKLVPETSFSTETLTKS